MTTTLCPADRSYPTDQTITCSHLPDGRRAWIVTGYREARAVLSDARFVIPPAGRIDTAAAAKRSTPIESDQHVHIRKIAATMFGARRAAGLRDTTTNLVERLVEDMRTGGPPADIVAVLAGPLPVAVIGMLLGVTIADREQICAWSDVSWSLSGYTAQEVDAARAALRAYVTGLVEPRANGTTEGFFCEILRGGGRQIVAPEELIEFGVALLIAGHQTTRSHLASSLFLLLREPHRWNMLCQTPSVIDRTVEELLRYIPVVGCPGSLPRVADVDVELAGVHIVKGDLVFAVYAAANRDPEIFDHPNHLDLNRDRNPHIAFGFGFHRCLGAELARMELQVALGVLCSSLPSLRLAVPPQEVTWRTDFLIQGPSTVPVRW